MGDKQLERFLEDEKLAMVLQNQEFMRELRHNKDFMLSLEKDRQINTTVAARNIAPVETPANNVPIAAGNSSGHSPQTQTQTPTRTSPVTPAEPVAGAVGGHPAAAAAPHDDAVLRERLKHMGKSTRKKFDKLAKMFHRKNVNRAKVSFGMP
ncbi:CUE domain-containing protein 1 [Desmophyllum pertusum]|uniref:CUE domain-containing protein 1 n=1 Tax=Desmophyllum pertusum TaxID=174260 RepID=A0A9W9ZTS0_9CNID|nr:CUE domain-containing protein 1 [Desmophyllum pertusum]